MSDELIGRLDELASIREFLDAIPQGPRVLILDGEAGIGKTRLWQEAVNLARERGYGVLSARPASSEVQLSFAALSDLLGPTLEETLGQLRPMQRRALEVALLLAEAEGTGPDPRALGLALLACLHMLAQGGPLLLGIDDIQWLDLPSARVLAFALRRLEREPIGLLAAARAGAGLPLEIDRDLADVQHLRVGPLSLGTLHQLLRARLNANFSRHTLVRLQESCGGNPFYALEIGRFLRERGLEADAEEPVPLPDNLRDLVRARLSRLSRRTREVLLAAAALSQPTLPVLEAASNGATAEVERAVQAGVVEVDGKRVRFSHPLLATAHYSAVSASERRELHRRLAGVVADDEERARHLALAADEPDTDVATALEGAARSAKDRLAPDAAADLAEQALRLTPATLPALVFERRLALAEYRFEVGDTKRAEEALKDAIAPAPPGALRARALWQLSKLRGETKGLSATIELCREALAEKDIDDPLRAAILHNLAFVLLLTGALDEAALAARDAVELGERAGNLALLAAALGTLAAIEFRLGGGLQGDMLERAIQLERSSGEVWLDYSPRIALAFQLRLVGHLDDARPLLEELREQATEHADLSLWTVLWHLAELEFMSGNWSDALRCLDEAYEVASQSGRETAEAVCLSQQAVLHAHLGNVEATQKCARAAIPLAQGSSQWPVANAARAALGFLELSLGNPPAAREHLDTYDGGLESRPSLHVLTHIESLTELGELERAEPALDEFEERARKIGMRPALVAVARCRGQLAAHGDLLNALHLLESAIEEYGRLPAPQPFQLGRLLLALGTVQRRAQQKRAARQSLKRALEIFEALPARLWAEQTRSELHRIGGRIPHEGELSETERQIVELVAAGRSNKQVAQELSLSPKTVEWNLSKVYRKLGVHSRTELAHRLLDEVSADR